MVDRKLFAVGCSFYNDAASLERCFDSIVLNLPMRYLTVLCLDGKYAGYPERAPLSTDGSREVVFDYQERYGKDKFQLFDFPNLQERYKRQKYVDLAADQGYKFLLIIDSDEFVVCKKPAELVEEISAIDTMWHRRKAIDNQPPGTPPISGIEKIPHIANVHMVRGVEANNEGYIVNFAQRPRLWHRPQEMHYTTKHYYWISDDMQNNGQALQDGMDPKKYLARTAVAYQSYLIQNLELWHSHSLRTRERDRKRLIYERERLPRLEGPGIT
jgi:hypothetical protein